MKDTELIDKDGIVNAAKNSKSPKKNITFRLRESLIEELRAACRKEGISMNAVVEELMRLFLK